MVVITDNRYLVAYARTNRRLRWEYSDYCGRWATIYEAIFAVRERHPEGRVEYRFENRMTNEVITGYLE